MVQLLHIVQSVATSIFIVSIEFLRVLIEISSTKHGRKPQMDGSFLVLIFRKNTRTKIILEKINKSSAFSCNYAQSVA